MEIRSGVATTSDYEAIAGAMGIQLYNVRELHRTAHRNPGIACVLRPIGEDYRLVKVDQFTGRPRRIWAISWDGHYLFMRALFNIDPHAHIRSAISEYRGVEGFERNAYETAHRNVGSLYYPQTYADCAIERYDTETLDRRALEIVREIGAKVAA